MFLCYYFFLIHKILQPYSNPWKQIQRVALGEYQASSASYSAACVIILRDLCKNTRSFLIVPRVTKILQNFRLILFLVFFEYALNNPFKDSFFSGVSFFFSLFPQYKVYDL